MRVDSVYANKIFKPVLTPAFGLKVEKKYPSNPVSGMLLAVCEQSCSSFDWAKVQVLGLYLSDIDRKQIDVFCGLSLKSK